MCSSPSEGDVFRSRSIGRTDRTHVTLYTSQLLQTSYQLNTSVMVENRQSFNSCSIFLSSLLHPPTLTVLFLFLSLFCSDSADHSLPP